MNDLCTAALQWARSPACRDMTIRQYAILCVLCDEKGPHTVRGLAERLNVSRPVICRAMDAFEAGDIAVRIRDEDDGRNVWIAPTDYGRYHRNEIKMVTA